MNTDKFLGTKDFLDVIFLSKEDRNMNHFIRDDFISVVFNKISEGYKLNNKQDYEFKQVLVSNCHNLNELENILKYSPNDKYVYHILFHNFKNLLEDNINEKKELEKYSLLQDWMFKQNTKSKSSYFFKLWIENMTSYTNSNSGTKIIMDSFQDFQENKELLYYLSNEEKNNLLIYLNTDLTKCIKKFIKSEYDMTSDINQVIKSIKFSEIKSEDIKINSNDIMLKLKLENEEKIISLLMNVNKQYELIFADIESLEMMRRNNVIKLYNEHLIENLNQYIKIKKETRTILINKSSSQNLMEENIKDVEKVFSTILNELNEQKLNNLSTKKDYLTQLKKQW